VRGVKDNNMAEAEEIKEEPVTEENSEQSSWWGSSWLQAAKSKVGFSLVF